MKLDEGHRNRRLITRAVLLALALVVFAIRMIDWTPRRSGVDAPAPLVDASPSEDAGDDANAPLAARCGDREGLPLPPGAYEMGDALLTKDRLFVGVAHDLGGKHVGALVTLSRDGDTLSSPKLDDSDELPADAPPPKAILLGGKPVLAMYVQQKGARTLAIDVARIPQQSDGSFAFDVATTPEGRGLVAWDEDAAGAPRGVVKVVTLPLTAGAEGRVVSPDSSDADAPRVAARPGGYWIAWLARKPEPERDAAPELEGPGEKRHTTWLEVAQLDPNGQLVGAPARIAKAGSRVESFDMLAHDDTLDVLVKDDEQPADDEGSRLVLVTLRGAETLVRVIVPRGVGRGVPDLLGARAVFSDLTDHAQLVPIAPGGRPSLEHDLANARPLAALGDRVVAGFPKDSVAPLGVLRCFEAPRPLSRKQ